MLQGAFAFVDLETTGCNPVHDRITEVAIVSVRDGEVTERWSQLVDPGVSIPEAIQALTGISNAMVAGQPAFEDIASRVHERLDGVTFVAHNARFDHGFLRNALARCGFALKGPVLCTVKLSRRLYPAERGHGLDALIARHGLACSARHRALGDAEATHAFVVQAAASRPAAELARIVAELTRRPALPARLGEGIVEQMPDAPGVYLFFDERDTPLYVGKSVHLRSRVLSHFSADHSSAKEMQLAQQTARIEWQRTAGELGALLKEAQLVKDLAPVYNRQLRRHAELVSIRWGGSAEDLPDLVDGAHITAGELQHLHGLYRSKSQARKKLLELADEHGLCLRLLGLEKGKGACFRYQVRKCAGACGGHEPMIKHQARLAAALARLKLVSWPWQGPIGIRECDPESGEAELHIVDTWCYLGTARSDDELHQGDLFARRPAFDMDTYKLLVKHLLRNRSAQVVPLAGASGILPQRSRALPRRAARV